VPFGGTARDLLEAAVFACELEPDDPLERSILARARREGASPEQVRKGWSLTRDYPFERTGKHMTHVWRSAAHEMWCVVAKGAIEGILEHCRATPLQLRRAELENERLASDGIRVLAVARGRLAKPVVERAEAEHDLELVGLLGFRDPLRDDVPAAIADCRSAGIDVKLVTGDHPMTAAAIARQAGIDARFAVTGDELARLPPEERVSKIRAAGVLARIRPEQKHAIVEALSRTGEVVAMTGDGINDAPALRRADIGISLGIRGTEVARSAADLVLLEDDFAALVSTIREGRRIFDNLQRSFLFLIAFHVPIFGLALLPPLLGLPLLLLPVHLVWLELLVHPIAMLLFEAEPSAPDVMKRPPRDPKAGLLPRRSLLRSVATGVLLTVMALAIYAAELPGGEDHARAVALVALVCGDLLLVFVERAVIRGKANVWLPRTATFWVIWIAAGLTIPSALYVGPVAHALRVTAPPPKDLLLAIAAATAAVFWRAWPRRRGRR